MLCLCISGGVGEDRTESGVEAPLVDAIGVSSEGLDEGKGGDVYLEVGVWVEVEVGVGHGVPETPSITGFVWAEP